MSNLPLEVVEMLGQTMANFDAYLRQLNPHLPAMQHDFRAFADATRTAQQLPNTLVSSSVQTAHARW